MHKVAHDHHVEGRKKNLLGDDPSDPANAEPIWLILTTKKHIIPQPRLKPNKIHLPHSLNARPSLSVCLITPDPQRSFKDLIAHASCPRELAKCITRVIGIGKLEKKYKSFEAKRQIRDSHDVFLADDRILTYLSKSLGKTFYSSASKRPIPVRLQATRSKEEKQKPALPSTKSPRSDEDPKSIVSPQAAAKEIEQALSMTTVYLSPSVTTSIRVGLSSHTSEQLADNIEAVVLDVADKYVPRKWRGIQSIHIKGPNTMALPIWLADELWQHEGMVVDDAEEAALRVMEEDGHMRKKSTPIANPVRLAIEAGLIEGGSKKRKSDDSNKGQEPPRKKAMTGDSDRSNKSKSAKRSGKSSEKSPSALKDKKYSS